MGERPSFTVGELELSEPLAPVSMGGRNRLLVLSRWHGRPLGWVWVDSAAAEADPATLQKAIALQLERPLIRTVLAESEPAPAGERPPISVVICTRNRAALLERCLASVMALRYPRFEVIVVDNAPTDEATRETVERFGARYAREERPGLDWARNRGIAEARHEIIAFTDDDATPDAGWLTGLAMGFKLPAIMAVTGLVAPMELDTEAQVLFEQVYGGMGKGVTGRLFDRDQMRPASRIAIHAVGVGANMAFRKSVFERIGGFDTALDVGTPASGAGDLDMFHRVVSAGMPLWYEPRALVWHQHRRETGELERQLYNDGRSFGVYLIKLWKEGTVPRLSLLRYATWIWGRWLVGRTVMGLLGKHRLPLPLLWAGLRGALGAPAAYRATYRSDRRLRKLPAPEPGAEAQADTFAVTVIIPSYNAESTLPGCLDSVLAQTHRQWEVIVVDDGSSDRSLEIAREYAARDARIRVLPQEHGGLSAARNRGLASARFPWLLFLDADDWILPRHLERMTAALQADPALDAVHCGWILTDPAGEKIEEGHCAATGDLFPILARHPAFVVHACLIRRKLVQATQGFDAGYSRVQDWVMWQRVARAGCRFGTVREPLAGYSMNPGSLSAEPVALLDEAVRVIALGHGPDPLLPGTQGRPAGERPEAALAYLGWAAGVVLAGGEDARGLLERVPPHPWPELTAFLGEIIHSALPRALGRPRSAWGEIWPRVGTHVGLFLDAMERHAQAPGLARSVGQDLARLVLQDSGRSLPRRIGRTQGVLLEITRPIGDIVVSGDAERLWGAVELEGERIGAVELPVSNGRVAGEELRDAISDQYSWTILGRFFERTVYRGSESHDVVGWETLLREIWSPDTAVSPARLGPDGWPVVELSAPLPDLSSENDSMVEVRAGGQPIGTFHCTAEALGDAVSFRRAINDAMGLELCRVVVRQALVGQAMDDVPLRTRLNRVADSAAKLGG